MVNEQAAVAIGTVIAGDSVAEFLGDDLLDHFAGQRVILHPALDLLDAGVSASLDGVLDVVANLEVDEVFVVFGVEFIEHLVVAGLRLAAFASLVAAIAVIAVVVDRIGNLLALGSDVGNDLVASGAELLEVGVSRHADSISGIDLHQQQTTVIASPVVRVIVAAYVQAKGAVIVLNVIDRAASNLDGLTDTIEDGASGVRLALHNDSVLVGLTGIKIIFNPLVGQESSSGSDRQVLVRQERVKLVDRVGGRIRHQTLDEEQERVSVSRASLQHLDQLVHNDAVKLMVLVEHFLVLDTDRAASHILDNVRHRNEVRNVAVVSIQQSLTERKEVRVRLLDRVRTILHDDRDRLVAHNVGGLIHNTRYCMLWVDGKISRVLIDKLDVVDDVG